MLDLKPLHPHQLLSWMAIPTFPGVYILGSFARHVTIYSQQMRAFNLIDALCKTGQLRPGTRVVIVGGGIAGVTAAAAATVRGAEVTIVETDKDFFPIQRHAGNRYLHPHIYDWPLYDLKPGLEDRADFPFLGWEAGEAEIVFRKLREKWDQLFKSNSQLRRPKLLMETRVSSLANRAGTGCVELTIEKTEPDETNSSASETLQTKIAILALGFGREISSSDLRTYWEQAPFDATTDSKLRWLVSGYGDGGLTDLMRLCIDGFRHDVFVKKYETDPDVAAKLKKLLATNKRQNVRDVFEELYQQLNEQSLIEKKDLRSNTEVVFNAPAEYLESEGSSILNKFLVFQLEKLGKFQRQEGLLRLPNPKPNPKNDKYTIEFTDKSNNVIAKADFDRVIVRHGPKQPVSKTSFPEIWEATEDLRTKWAAQLQSEDRTRLQLWDRADYEPSTAPNPIMLPIEPPIEVDLRCVIVESTDSEESTLSKLVRAAVNGNKKAIGPGMNPPRSEGNFKAGFETIKINEVLNGQKEYNHAVRLLCNADVAVIDVTHYEPGVMLLLGIRSAVRRGVTVVTTNVKLDAAEWSRLPFNLKELYPLSLASDDGNPIAEGHPIQVMGRTIAKALANYHALPFYQDLPAYEAVRRSDGISQEEAQTILWLCSFNRQYDEHAKYIQRGYIEEYGNDRNGDQIKYPLERITEIVSPQLVTQRLYSAIRRTVLCLVDWSFWSPNVFFEFGVRLAVSNFGPICLLASDTLELAVNEGNDSIRKDSEIKNTLLLQRERLKNLFRPLEYSLQANQEELFNEIRARHTAMQNHVTPGQSRSKIPPTFGAFPFDHTYKFVGRLLPVANELGAWSAHGFLTTAANSLVGVSITTEPTLPVLYANVNKDLDKQARNTAKEALIAAWYYLSNRYRGEWQQSPVLLKEFVDLSTRLANLLRESSEEKDQALHEVIRQELNNLRRIVRGEAHE